MISVVIPFYKKLTEFKYAFELANFRMFNQFPGLELIISVDDPAESEELIAYLQEKVRQACTFSIKVLVHQEPHVWRCPSVAINKGIKLASHRQIVVLSPETLVLPGSLEGLMKHSDASSFAIGIIKHVKIDASQALSLEAAFNQAPGVPLPYGSICFSKEQALVVGGYDEAFIIWGGDDDDFRLRLMRAGYQRKPVLSKFIHVELGDREINRSADKKEEKKLAALVEKSKKISGKKEFKVYSHLSSDEILQPDFCFSP